MKTKCWQQRQQLESNSSYSRHFAATVWTSCH